MIRKMLAQEMFHSGIYTATEYSTPHDISPKGAIDGYFITKETLREAFCLGMVTSPKNWLTEFEDWIKYRIPTLGEK